MLNRVLPKDGESLYGFVFRNAVANYYENITMLFDEPSSELYSNNNNYFKQGSQVSQEFCRILQLLGRDINDFVLNQYNDLFFSEEPSHILLGRFYLSYHTRFCPLCFREDPYHRLSWNVALVTCCLKHQSLLIDQCDQCGKKIKLNGLMKGECACGFAYAQATARPVQPGGAVYDAQNAIQELLLKKRRTVETSDGTSLDREEYFLLLSTFAALIDKIPGDHPVLSNIEFSVTQVNSLNSFKGQRDVIMSSVVGTAAHQLVMNPVVYFSKIVSLMEERRKDPRRFMYIKGRLRTVLEHPKGKAHMDVYSLYLREQASSYLSKIEAMEILKCSHKYISQLCKEGVLATHQKPYGKLTLTLIERDSLEKFQLIRESSVNLAEASRRLGCKSVFILRLIQHGVLSLNPGTITSGSQVHWQIDEFSVQKLVNAMFGEDKRVKLMPNHDWIPFNIGVNKLKHKGIGLAELIVLVSEDKIRSCVVSELPDLKGLFLMKEDVEKFSKELNSKRFKGRRLTTSDVKEHLGI